MPADGGGAQAWSQSLLSWATGAEPSKYGIAGVLSGAALVFFAFIGFDVVATSAEEVKDPQRTLPLGIRTEERRVGKECVIRVNLGGRRIIKKKKQNTQKSQKIRSYISYNNTYELLTYHTPPQIHCIT